MDRSTFILFVVNLLVLNIDQVYCQVGYSQPVSYQVPVTNYAQGSTYQQPYSQSTTVQKTVQAPSGMTKTVVTETLTQPMINQPVITNPGYNNYAQPYNGRK